MNITKNTIKNKTITIQDVKNDPDYSCGLEMLSDYGISAYLIYRGGDKVEYYIFHNRALLFQGDDLRPSPLHNIDGIEAIIDLLGFITVRPGDTDPEYFKDYTVDQLKWADSHECEQLSGLVSDFDNSSEAEYQTTAKEYFNSVFNC